MTHKEKLLEKRMAQMCIEAPGYLHWEPEKLKEHALWVMSVEQQMNEDITYRKEGYT